MALPSTASGPAGRRPLSALLLFLLLTSAAGPLATVVSTVPLGFAHSGAGMPASYLIATVVMICFAVGYTAISRRMVNTGAFYTYVARGISRPAAVGAAFLAVLAYFVNAVGIAAGFGYFVGVALNQPGSWVWGTLVGVAIVGVIGYFQVTLSARVLGVVAVAGLIAFGVFDVIILVHSGLSALPLSVWQPETLRHNSPGYGLMFAFAGFVGIESAALYSEETRSPQRSVPRALYGAILVTGVFYILSVWLLVGSIGPSKVSAAGARQLGNLVTDQATAIGGSGLYTAVGGLSLLGTLAGMLAFHNATSRYLYVLGRDRVLPARLAQLHPRWRSPAFASLVVTAATVVLLGLGVVLGLDPYTQIAQGLVSVATLGIIALCFIACLAIITFFRRQGYRSYWRTLLVPGLGAVGLGIVLLADLFNFKTLVQSDADWVRVLPWVLVVVVVAGIITGTVIRSRHPARYARLAESRLRPQARSLPRPAAWERRYCLIGAGPAGLAMGRRLAEEGIPFDWFERSDDVGGLWHLDRPGSPLYDGLRTVTSAVTSGFPDYPMSPEPAYPQWWQIRDYLRGFARDFGLYERITFNTAVTWLAPEGIGWGATLTSGERRYYAGVIIAAGPTQTPVMPAWPGRESFQGTIGHASQYFYPRDLAGRRVLVVGAGVSGADIACDAARTASVAFLSVRRGYRFLPRYLSGVPTDAVLAGVVDPPSGVTLPPDPTEMVATLAATARPTDLPTADYERLAGHPVVTDDLLDAIAGGWLHVRGDVSQVLPNGVRFADSRVERVDLIIAATGYDRRPTILAQHLVPEADDLYLALFSRQHDGLTILGVPEFAGATFPRFDEMARVVVVDITLRELAGPDWHIWREAKRIDRPDVWGGHVYADAPPDRSYVDDHAYSVLLGDVCDRYGYAPPRFRRPVVDRPTATVGRV
jgi:cation diffusion facilitator CzcD-associated flavoprotein CzcO/amino acid transporter